MSAIGNWIKETTATTGTGTVTLAAVTGRPRFADQFSVGDVVSYVIKDGNNWEAGIGKVGATNTLSRDKVAATYASGVYTINPASGLALSGASAEVYCTTHATNHRVGPPAMPAITANNKLYPGANLMGVSATAFVGAGTTNRLLAYPFEITHGGPFNGFAVRGTGSANVDIGLYTMLPDGTPGRKVVGVVVQAMVAGMNYFSFASQFIPPGWYFMAINFAAAAYPYRATYGGPTLNSWSDTASLNPMMHLNFTAGSLPDPFGVPSALEYSLDGNYVPAVSLRFG